MTATILSYTLLIHSNPTSQSSYSALRFAEAALQQGHTITQVFFYHDGVQHATSLVCLPTDEFDVAKAWEKLSKQYQFNLMVCIAAGLRRGIIDSSLAAQHEKLNFNMNPCYQIVGLGQFIEATINSDRTLVFDN